jgi:predicted 3-demethylubiquinone-9 3-methyltransferase (glyoxalase superfamily)/uncharacterized protein YndB with AHSA1/START domain
MKIETKAGNDLSAPRITPHLWFDKEAVEAAEFYVSIFPNSRIDSRDRIEGGPPGDCDVVSFTLAGQPFMAISAGPLFKFNEAVSLVVPCKTQDEIDYYWEKLNADPNGGGQCGWIKDKFGLSWQITPTAIWELMPRADAAAKKRLTQAILSSKKFDIRRLMDAFEGRSGGNPSQRITVETTVAAPLDVVWKAYTTPEDIKRWNAASDDWHTTSASVDLQVGGHFSSRMEAKDGSMGFDFAGTYIKIVPNQLIEYVFGDRRAEVAFTPVAGGVKVRVTFDSETTHSIEQQRSGWQSILDNFARHAETKKAA